MSHILIFLVVMTLTSAEKNQPCNGFQANLNLRSIVGAWRVVAIIPQKLFPDHKQISCFKVEFSETDEAGLRWLVNETSETPGRNLTDIKGPIVRQRYHTEHPFDVWSNSVEGINGCFRQVFSLDTDKSDIYKAVTHNETMQLHIVNSVDATGPFLVQMLWGKMIAAVIYRREQGITQDQLKPVFELMSKLRGPPRLPRICDTYVKDMHVLKH